MTLVGRLYTASQTGTVPTWPTKLELGWVGGFPKPYAGGSSWRQEASIFVMTHSMPLYGQQVLKREERRRGRSRGGAEKGPVWHWRTVLVSRVVVSPGHGWAPRRTSSPMAAWPQTLE
jgi:hypothetical protein